ncbi:MAG: T9SS type A sorting domain-containing protein [Saprospiraceae bacterium]|nr:T9SS type A sorting domain-containing protein [Saprospiraceae bacterium]
MKHTFNIIILMLSTISSYSQKHDYNWHLGYRIYDTAYLPHRGITNINFNTLSLNPSFKYDSFKIIDFDWTCNDISDEDGNYLFSYNGYTVENYLNQIIQNGKGEFSSQKTSKDVNYQGGLILNLKRLNEFILVHDKHNMELFSPNFQSDGLRYSLINIQHKINEGKVIKKDYKILEDTLDYGRLLSIKHANGRDWWIIRGRYNMKSFYKFIVINDTVIINDLQVIGEDQYLPLGGVTTSPNGKNIVYFHQHVGPLHGLPGENGFFINTFNFDRNSGILSNPKTLKISQDTGYLFGAAFSPNGKYLYVSRINYIFQIDMTRDSLVLDTVAVFDGFNYISLGNFQIFTWFGFIERAPDGRIYGNTGCCTQQYLFYINKPNLKGKACDVKQHAIKITSHNNLPSFPNYRLGPIDGSPSDSLGIDNIPVAEFRYDQDTMNYRSIDFTNLSWYEAEEFWWDWGDGSQPYYTTVWDTSIIHTYAKDGIYEVCLRAKNKNGETTKCKKINIGTTAIKDEADNPLIDITLSPNPMREMLIIQVNDYLPEKMIMNLYDLHGNKITTKRLYEGSNIITTESLSSGVYIVEIIERNRIVTSEKIVKV